MVIWAYIAHEPTINWLYSYNKMKHNKTKYRQTSNKSRALVGNDIFDHSDVFGASPVGAALTTSSFSTLQLASMDWANTTARRDENHLSVVGQCVLY